MRVREAVCMPLLACLNPVRSASANGVLAADTGKQQVCMHSARRRTCDSPSEAMVLWR